LYRNYCMFTQTPSSKTVASRHHVHVHLNRDTAQGTIIFKDHGVNGKGTAVRTQQTVDLSTDLKAVAQTIARFMVGN
jgi:hypothetical protein